jgi:hypothetical protein
MFVTFNHADLIPIIGFNRCGERARQGKPHTTLRGRAPTHLALAREHALAISSSSIKWSFTGGLVGWTMNTSSPRTLLVSSTLISPSANCATFTTSSALPSRAAIALARGRFDRPQRRRMCQRLVSASQSDGSTPQRSPAVTLWLRIAEQSANAGCVMDTQLMRK